VPTRILSANPPKNTIAAWWLLTPAFVRYHFMFMKTFSRFGVCFGCLVVIGLACIIGCGDNLPRRVPVSGRVLIDGKPLETGTLLIETPGQRPSHAALGPGGKFTVGTFSETDGTMPGKHRVAIISKEDINGKTVKWLIPKKYTDLTTSGMEIDVPGARNDVELRLSWEGGKPFIEKYQ
jgi:hypothetical protein